MLKEGTNLREGLLSRMRFRLHWRRSGCGPQDSEDLTEVLQGASHWRAGETLWKQLAWVPVKITRGCVLLDLQQQAATGHCAKEQEGKHKSPEEKPLPLVVTLQCPLLTNLKLHQLTKEKSLQGPAAVSQDKARI